jgi:hypothetical protein
MLPIDRWRTWRPTGEKSAESTGNVLTKPTKHSSVGFVVPILEETQNISGTMQHPSPAAWAEDFHHWALHRCVYRDRWFSGIRALYRDFRDWSLDRDEVPCSMATFERLLLDAGFLLANGMVSGLTLESDWESYNVSKKDSDARQEFLRSQRGE